MSAASSSMPHLGSARLTLRALSVWPNEDGPAHRLQIPLSADEDTNACTTSLSMRRSDCNRNPWRTQPGKPSSASSMDPRPWPGSRRTGPTLWQGSGKPREAQQWRRLIGGIASEAEMARPKRFELLTPRFVVWCSIQLSYGRVFRAASDLTARTHPITYSEGRERAL
jgi:hypothetical protein